MDQASLGKMICARSLARRRRSPGAAAAQPLRSSSASLPHLHVPVLQCRCETPPCVAARWELHRSIWW